MNRGPLIILSGPSGCGKSTVIKRLLDDRVLPLHLAVSATTRDKREGEIDGFHYHFWTREQFLVERDRDGFLEWAEVYGNLYGTPLEPPPPGCDLVLVIDVQGARQVLERVPGAVMILVVPPSRADQRARLESRGDPQDQVGRRLAKAEEEEAEGLRLAHHVVVNADLDRAVEEVAGILGRYRQPPGGP